MIYVKSFMYATCMMLVILLAGGCKKEVSAPPPAPPKKVQKPVQAVVTSVVKEEYVYNVSGKRDPFKPFIELEKKGESKVPSTPLQAYDVNELKLVGVILLPGKKIAMIEDPTGKGYNVKIGVPIGRNDGTVVDILKNEIVVEEKLVDEMGLSKTRRVSITMPFEKEGEGK